MQADESQSRLATASEREFFYVIDPGDSSAEEQLTVEVLQRERRIKGGWGKLKTKRLGLYEINSLADSRDRQVLAMLFGAVRASETGKAVDVQEFARKLSGTRESLAVECG